MEEKKETFTYTYSAAQQAEIAAIRQKYAAGTPAPEADKLAQLRRLDAGVTKKAMASALSLGILGALVMGTGMSLIMTDLAAILGMASPWIPGLITGILGMAGVIAAYPLYRLILKKERARIAPQILKLTEELASRD